MGLLSDLHISIRQYLNADCEPTLARRYDIILVIVRKG
jgi:hypothetical protein